MPTYDYACDHCGGFDALRRLALRDQPVECPDCGKAAPRVLVAAPRLSLIADSIRLANDTNERARHEPKQSRDYARLKHPAGCGCCSTPGRRGATLTAANGNKAFPAKRPWMISH
jgi:putative FmdB family regulatory protein